LTSFPIFSKLKHVIAVKCFPFTGGVEAVTEDEVLEKNNRINLLFDFYEPLLTDKQITFTRYYFQDNYTLGEIASLFQITRQAVYEHIKRAEAVLESYESKLQLLDKHQQRGQLLRRIEDQLEAVQGAMTEYAKRQVITLLEQIDTLS
jgi:predicted DNA-binding protein YlxM (UPF0122 family)